MLKAEHTILSKGSEAKKPPRPALKGIVIKDSSKSEASRPKAESQGKADPKNKGK